MEERRKSKRVPVNAIMLYKSQEVIDPDRKTPFPIGTPISVDIGEGGLQIVGDQQIEVGTKLDIVLSIVDTQVPIELEGKVIWVKDAEEEGSYRIGIEFTDFNNEESKKMLDDYIKSD